MKCLRCGYCCVQYLVGIIIDPDKEVAEDNVVAKESGVRCRHLVGDTPGNFSCKLHGLKMYKETPCFEFGQIERSPKEVCRMGKFILNQTAEKQRALVLMDR